jgi:hypothetical protein
MTLSNKFKVIKTIKMDAEHFICQTTQQEIPVGVVKTSNSLKYFFN